HTHPPYCYAHINPDQEQAEEQQHRLLHRLETLTELRLENAEPPAVQQRVSHRPPSQARAALVGVAALPRAARGKDPSLAAAGIVDAVRGTHVLRPPVLACASPRVAGRKRVVAPAPGCAHVRPAPASAHAIVHDSFTAPVLRLHYH